MTEPALTPDQKATAALLQLAAHAERLAAIEQRLAGASEDTEDTASKAYRPKPAPRWWLLRGAEREQALTPLHAWVAEIYRPMYGHLAALLPPCWQQHPLCLLTLDWLSELWQALYLRASRAPGILVSQAEWQTRLLPAAADQMHRDAVGCAHRQAVRP